MYARTNMSYLMYMITSAKNRIWKYYTVTAAIIYRLGVHRAAVAIVGAGGSKIIVSWKQDLGR